MMNVGYVMLMMVEFGRLVIRAKFEQVWKCREDEQDDFQEQFLGRRNPHYHRHEEQYFNGD